MLLASQYIPPPILAYGECQLGGGASLFRSGKQAWMLEPRLRIAHGDLHTPQRGWSGDLLHTQEGCGLACSAPAEIVEGRRGER